MDTWRQDVRHAIRLLAGAPTFTAAAVVSLAIAFGANAAVFSVANALILRPLPYPDPDRLAIVWQRSPGLDVAQDWLSRGQYLDIAQENTVFERAAAAIGVSFNVTGDAPPERVDGVRVSSSFFPLFGVRAELGRVYTAEDDEPGRAPTVLLTHAFWTRHFGADSAVVGRTIELNDVRYTVVGVTAAGFTFDRDVMPAVNAIDRTELLLPLPIPPSARSNRGGEDFDVFARLKPGVTLAQAQADLDVIAKRMQQEYPAMYPAAGGLTLSVVPLMEQVLGDMRPTLYILLGAVALVLLIACGNVANLLLSRANARARELAIRAAVGADRGRLVRQLATESLLLSIAGGMAGVALGFAGIASLRFFAPANIPRAGEVHMNAGVFALTGALALLTPLLFGLGPAFLAARTDPNTVLRGAVPGHAGGGHRRREGRRLLIAAEVALSVVVLLGAGLLLRSYARVTRADPGFQAGGVLSFRLSLPLARYATPEAVSQFYRGLEERARALPGVMSVGSNYQLPLSSVSLAWEPIEIEGYVPKGPADDRIISNSAYISPDYFRAMGIRLIRGRPFTEHDDRNATPVAIVDDKLAARFWPSEDPIGKRLKQAGNRPWRTVIGVVANTREYEAVKQPPITVYFPVEQFRIGQRFVVVRTAPGVDSRATLAAVLREVRSLDPQLPAYDVSTMQQRIRDSLSRRRLTMLVLAAFAIFALILSAVGTYGVIAFWVGRRRREIGIRMALGADRARIVRLVGREVVAIVGLGLVAGVAIAVLVTRVMSGLLFGISPNDPATYAAVTMLVVLTAVMATFVPTRRAARVEASVALREE